MKNKKNIMILGNYRIIKHKEYRGDYYEVQKKLWIFPIWFNFNNIDAETTGFYNSELDAVEAILINKHKVTKKIIKEI